MDEIINGYQVEQMIMNDIDFARNNCGKSIGETLKSVRIAKNMSQKDVSAKIGVNPTMLSAWEKKTSNPSFKTIMKICAVLRVTVAIFSGCVNE